MADKKFLNEDGVSQFAEETKKYIDKHANNADIHVTANDKSVWNGKQDALTSQQLANIADVVNKANASDLTAHTNNADIHVTTNDKANWNAKADVSDIPDVSIYATKTELNVKANDDDVVHKSGNETIAGNKTFSNSPTVTRTNVGTAGYVVKLSFKRGEETSAVNHSTFRVTDSENSIVSEVCTENYTDGKVAQVLNVRNANDAGAQVQSSISHMLDKTGEQDWFYSTRDGKTYLGTLAYKWADVNTVLLNGKTPAYDDDVVHKSGNETVGGVKTFTSSTVIDGSGKFYQAYATGYIKGGVPSAAMYQGIRFYDDQKNSTVDNHITGSFELMYNTDGYNKAYIGCRNYSGTSQLTYNVGLRVPNDDTKSVDFFPSTDNKINLGTSNYRWADTNTVLLNGKTPAYADDLSAVATSGSYNDLSDKPSIPVIDSALSSTSTNGLQNKVIKSALDGKANSTHTHSASDITSGLATVATSGSYEDLSNKPTIPTVNNATLTIQKNGTNVQTFTANQSTNATANITVPTKTSELTNDSGFITSDNTKIPLSGSNAISGSLIPSSDGTVNLGSSIKAFANIYGKRIGQSVTNAFISIDGGTDFTNGAELVLYGKDSMSPNLFGLYTYNSTNTERYQLHGIGSTLSWSGTAIQYTSDQRLKQQISNIDDKLLDAWEDVELSQFKYNDAVEEKGKVNARLHTGYVVQQIDEACKKHNVDISAYGLYCHEEYADETMEVEVEQEDGTKTTEVVRPASEHYSLRYTEALIVECAYLRKCIKELRNEIEELKKGNNTKNRV